jgi:hypothetical protein
VMASMVAIYHPQLGKVFLNTKNFTLEKVCIAYPRNKRYIIELH